MCPVRTPGTPHPPTPLKHFFKAYTKGNYNSISNLLS
jgi:hypothetical protein